MQRRQSVQGCLCAGIKRCDRYANTQSSAAYLRQLDTVKYNNGKLVQITNASGHYLPNTSETANFLKIFRKAGVKVDDATLTILKEDGTIFKQVSPTSSDRLTYY